VRSERERERGGSDALFVRRIEREAFGRTFSANVFLG
jgi:hypothetical protein